MKKFINYNDVLNHHPYCPFCNTLMVPNFHTVPLDMKCKPQHNNFISSSETDNLFYLKNNYFIEINLYEGVDSAFDEILQIDTETNCSIIERRSRNHYSYDFKHTSYYQAKNYTSGSALFDSLSVMCEKCHNFEYVVQFKCNFYDSNSGFIEYFLNSEIIYLNQSINKKQIVTNNYVTKMTLLTLFNYNSSEEEKTFSEMAIPLIDFDFKNPQETIDRVKKLVIFS